MKGKLPTPVSVPEIRSVDVRRVLFDAAYQQEVSQAEVRRIAADWDEGLYWPIAVNVRPDGKMYCMDGRTRTEARLYRATHVLSSPSQEDFALEARVYTHEPIEFEASYYELMCTPAKSYLAQFWSRVLRGDDALANAAVAAVEANGYSPARTIGAGRDTISGMKTVEAMLVRFGQSTVEEALSIFRAAWGSTSPSSPVIDALAHLAFAHGSEIKFVAFAARLKDTSPQALLAQVALSRMSTPRDPHALYVRLLDIYNHGRPEAMRIEPLSRLKYGRLRGGVAS